MLTLLDENDGLVDRILWSDESTFHLNGNVNRHNSCYWSDTNPHEQIEKEPKSLGLSVWAAISSEGVIGPYFFHNTPPNGHFPHFSPCNVNMHNYLDLLENYFWPKFSALPNAADYAFMHDGAPPHYSHNVRNWLNINLRHQWIGRGQTNDACKLVWPPRSPDLTPCDYYLWGHIKQLTYAKKPSNLFELQDAIVEAFQQITIEMCQKVCRSVPGRLKTCMELGGAQVVKNMFPL